MKRDCFAPLSEKWESVEWHNSLKYINKHWSHGEDRYAVGIAVTEQRSAVKSETIASWIFWSYSSRLHSVTNRWSAKPEAGGSAEFYCACLNLTAALPKYSAPGSSNAINIHARDSYRFPLLSQILWNSRFHRSKEKENLTHWLSFEAEPSNTIMFSHHVLPSPPTWHFVSLKPL